VGFETRFSRLVNWFLCLDSPFHSWGLRLKEGLCVLWGLISGLLTFLAERKWEVKLRYVFHEASGMQMR
jgi:hypothetical protein